jgi:hypothetical protein
MGSFTSKDGTSIFYKDWGQEERLCFLTAGR